MKSHRRRALSSTLTLALCLLSMGPLPTLASAEPPADLPIVVLENEVAGQAAINALGADLQKVAAAHGKSVSELARALKDDNSLHVDTKGRLVYKEEALPADLAADISDSAPWSQSGTYPLSETFTLHSNPGSKRVIYLDFDGHVLSGTAWNSGTVPATLDCPAWDTDGNPSVFGDAERTKIQAVWKRVAEDYAPFDVDVTTQAPADSALRRDSTSDEYYGMRVLISPISSYFGSYGGIAYVGVFDSTNEAYKPALVFPEKLANNDRYIGEAAAHECGHTLGLFHDGTTSGAEYYAGHGSGATGWAPIMGNSYYQALTQWSKGEYNLANNKEDDLAVVGANGAPLKADDYPDASANAPRLPSGTSISASGLIGVTGDTDVFSFSSGSGSVSLSLTPAAIAPDLDATLELRSEAGDLVASSNPLDGTTASISAVVGSGTYYVYVRGTGKGDPLATGYTDYGSLGAWNLAGTVPNPGASSAPVAVLSPSATTGVAPAAFAFDASASYDPDGQSVTWQWDFGDGTSGTGSTAAHTYAQPGSYSAVVTVTDASGMSSTASAQISVTAPNSAPTANMTISGAGVAPATVMFDGTGSSDPDGSIASWTWDFGDGSTGSGSTASHLYTRDGMFTAKLTVTDSAGATAIATALVYITPAPVETIHVASVTLATVTTRAGKSVKASVLVVDSKGTPVSGAGVTGTWSGIVTGTSSGTTGSSGVAVISSKNFKKSGTVTFAITNVTKSGYAYDASQNVVSKASIGMGSKKQASQLLR